MSTQRSLKKSKETYLNQFESEMKYIQNHPGDEDLQSEIKINEQFQVLSLQFKGKQDNYIHD